ncbi:MAG: DUF1015 domain-containing protein [Treponema sp.]|nr:DUF1015 domain-containing protein [Treponema sp.]
MKTINELGIYIPEILLPKNIDVKSWSVIACDQYTQNPEYWKKTSDSTEAKPSTLNLILPEVYLNAADKPARIEKIRKTMNEYISGDVFADPLNSFIYLERTTAFGRMRKGLMVCIDLETYEWKPFTTANIRATEATIVERIPPRMEIRKGAPLELPHIMLLVNDKDGSLVEACGENAKKGTPVYDGEMMMNGGKISGWAVTDNSLVEKALNKIAEENRQADGSTFLFAVGDGNHSLATAKATWDEHKKSLSGEELVTSNVRYALVEIVNIYDTGLTFEPIHRVVFDADSSDLLQKLSEKLGGKIVEASSKEEMIDAVKKSNADFGFAFKKDGAQKYMILKTDIKELAVSKLQPALDEYLKAGGMEIDYIHGTEDVLELGTKDNGTGILLPPIAKDSFFETIGKTGPLPRKSFSMGEADEKRFYLECRKLFN